MNVPLYGLLGVAAAILIYIVGLGMIVKLFICLITLILGYNSDTFNVVVSGTLICIDLFFYNRIITCIYRTYGANLDNTVKSEREDINKKTEKLRQVNQY